METLCTQNLPKKNETLRNGNWAPSKKLWRKVSILMQLNDRNHPNTRIVSHCNRIRHCGAVCGKEEWQSGKKIAFLSYTSKSVKSFKLIWQSISSSDQQTKSIFKLKKCIINSLRHQETNMQNQFKKYMKFIQNIFTADRCKCAWQLLHAILTSTITITNTYSFHSISMCTWSIDSREYGNKFVYKK